MFSYVKTKTNSHFAVKVVERINLPFFDLSIYHLKVELSHFKKNIICFIESPLKITKNVFDFILKALSVLSYLNFCVDSLAMQKKRLDQKHKFIFKIFDISAWLTITIYILPSILRSKGNQTMKFRHVIDYNKRNIFLQNRC